MLKSMLINGYTCAKIACGELCLWRVLWEVVCTGGGVHVRGLCEGAMHVRIYM